MVGFSYSQGAIESSMNQAGSAVLMSKKAELQNIKNPEKIKEASKDFEAVFITQMLQHMFEGVETDEIFGGGHGEEVMKTLLFDEYGKTISKAGGIGIAKHVQDELIKLQGGAL